MMKQTIKTMFALLMLLISSTGVLAQEKSYYLDEYGDSHDFYYSSYTALTSSGTGVTIGGDYYVEGSVTIDGTVAMNANTSIILCDGATLTIDGGSGKGIDDNTHLLAIFGQSSGSHAGKLVVSGATGAISCEIFAIYSGQVQATSIGGCGIEAKSVYLNNGQVTAIGATKDIYANNGTGRVRIGNGKVTANGNDNNIYSMGEIIIEGGQVTANSGTSGISATNITLGWTNASDFILASNYTGTVRTAAGMPFNIEGGGTLAADTDVDKASVAGKTLTPNTTVPVYTITINSITNGTVESNKNVAFAGERVVLTPTPDAGYYYYDMSCTDAGSNDVDITKNVGDYQITMPAANVTVTASFGDKVAKNTYTGTEYASLKNALDEVSTDETIKILTDITGEGSNTKDVGSKDITIDLNGKSVVFGRIDIMQNLTIKNGTLTIGKIYNASADNNYAITFDNATVTVNSVGGNALEWYANNLVLKNGSHVTIKEHLFLGGGSGPTVTIADINSWLELIDCTVSGYASKAVIEAAFAPYLQPGKTLIADGYTLNTVGFRKTWGVQLNHSFGANATVTFWDGGTATEPTAATFDSSTYTDANKKTYIDNSSATADSYIIMHIVPADGYWTDEQLLMAMETGASLAPSKAPGLDLGQPVTLLKRDTYNDSFTSEEKDRYDGAGWYYYKLPKEHNVNTGYFNSTLDGFVVPKFDLSDANAANISQSGNVVTVTDGTANGWKAELTYNKLSWNFDGTVEYPQTTQITIKKGGTEAIALTTAEDIAKQIKNDCQLTQFTIGESSIIPMHSSNYCWFSGTDFTTTYQVGIPFTGSGTSAEPWQIATAADLNLLAKCVNIGKYTFDGKYLKQTAEITYNATTSAGFVPIGIGYGGSCIFEGQYDGDGKAIKNLTYSYTPSGLPETQPLYIGLFGKVSTGTGAGLVNNIKLDNCSFTVPSPATNIQSVGSIAGYVDAGATISNCFVTSGTVSCPVANVKLGAIVGASNNGTLTSNVYTYNTTVNNGSTLTGYTKRGITTTSLTDVSGAMLYVKQATVPAATTNGSTVTFNQTTKGTNRYDHGDDDFYYAVGQPITLTVTLGTRTDDVRTFYDELEALTMNGTDIKDALGFTMPETNAVVSATITESDWFTIPSNGKKWMSFYHQWTTGGSSAANYAVTDNTEAKTVAVKTITSVNTNNGTVTATDITNGVCFNGVPTLFYCENGLPATLKFTPVNGQTAPQYANAYFKGVTENTVMNHGIYVMNGVGDFIYAISAASDDALKAHRCYIDLNGAANAPQILTISGDETMGIGSVGCDNVATYETWYTLDGHKLDKKPTAKGVYIHNGKKVVIK